MEDVVARHPFRKAKSRIGNVCSGGLNHPLPSECSVRRMAGMRATQTFGGAGGALAECWPPVEVFDGTSISGIGWSWSNTFRKTVLFPSEGTVSRRSWVRVCHTAQTPIWGLLEADECSFAKRRCCRSRNVLFEVPAGRSSGSTVAVFLSVVFVPPHCDECPSLDAVSLSRSGMSTLSRCRIDSGVAASRGQLLSVSFWILSCRPIVRVLRSVRPDVPVRLWEKAL